MGKFKAKRPGFIPGWQLNAADLMFRGKTDKEIVETLWPDIKEDTGRQRLRKMRKDEKFQEYYRSLVSEWSMHHVGKAYNKLAEQIDSNQPWLANKAANDVIAHSKMMLTGMDDGTMVVKVEGMPELGTPES